VYSASWDGNPFHIYTTQAENPESRDLGIGNALVFGVSSLGEIALALTPDLTFFSGTLARTPISGGAPRKVTEDISDADWSSDGAAREWGRWLRGHGRPEG